MGYTAKKKISATSIYFESYPYKVHPVTGLIDFDELRKTALVFRPAMIICGASAYPRPIDFKKFREIADEVGAILLGDVAHISGLIATKQHEHPFDCCDVVTTTTHKSLRGPRSGMIFFKYSDAMPDIKERIDMAVFPGLQGGPHNHQIGGLAVQLLEVATPAFKEYSKQVVINARTIADVLKEKGHKLASDGTDNHLVLWDLRPHGLTGSKVEKVCEVCSISSNRNAVHGDASALSPGGVRIGSPAMTTWGLCSNGSEGRQLVWSQSVGIKNQSARMSNVAFTVSGFLLWRSCGSAADLMGSWSRAIPTLRLGAVGTVGRCCYPEWAYAGWFVQFWTLISQRYHC